MFSIRFLAGILLLTCTLTEAQEWASIQTMLIKFYGYQRAGSKVGNTSNPFYKTAPYPHSQDNHQGNDLSGGWYDAGDFVKFGLPLGYSVYSLLKGYDAFPRGYDDLDSWDYKGAKDGIPDVLGEAKIATDYLMKAVISDAIVVTDVGNAVTDHQQLNESGYTNSQRTSPRSASASTGADVAGLYAASLALMAQLYKPHDAAYAAACLLKAKSAFTYGLLHPNLSAQQSSGSFYLTKTYVDKMACAAIELYRATGEANYLTHAQSFQSKVASHFFVLGYANVGDFSAFELSKLGFDAYQSTWLTDVNLALSRVVTSTSASELIRGAFIRSDWGNAGHAAAAAFTAALAFQVTGANAYRDFAIEQMKWVAGIAPYKQSYIVGFGNGPANPHHRNDVAMGSSGVRLKGGIVSGPTPVGTYNDGKPEATSWTFNGNDPANYKNTEVALDYNSAAVGALAFIRDYLNPPAGQVRIGVAVKATPDNVDLNTQQPTITFTLETAAPWKLVLTGRNSKAKKTIAGTTVAGSVKWLGDADEGSFSAGETVDIQLTDLLIPTYHASFAKATLFIKATKTEAFKAEDIIVDDFNDGDTTNALTGLWSTFTDKAAAGKSFTTPAGFAPAIGTAGGETLKGVSMRIVASLGAVKPMAGFRTTFNPAGTPVNLGPAKSIVFDVRSTAASTFWVELEQSDIVDEAHFGFQVQIGNDLWNRIRIPFTSLTQPTWKTSAKGFNPGSVKALRFVYHGEGTTRMDLDNVRIEGLKLGSAPIEPVGLRSRLSEVQGLRVLAHEITYQFQPSLNSEAWTVAILDVSGKVVFSESLERVRVGSWITLPSKLKRGIYFLSHQPVAEKGLLGVKQNYGRVVTRFFAE